METTHTVKEEIIKQIVSKIYRDTMVNQSTDYFIIHRYQPWQFKDLIDPKTFHAIVGFLPNSKYRDRPFIMSVTYSKKTQEYEIVVHNPKLKY